MYNPAIAGPWQMEYSIDSLAWRIAYIPSSDEGAGSYLSYTAHLIVEGGEKAALLRGLLNLLGAKPYRPTHTTYQKKPIPS